MRFRKNDVYVILFLFYKDKEVVSYELSTQAKYIKRYGENIIIKKLSRQERVVEMINTHH